MDKNHIFYNEYELMPSGKRYRVANHIFSSAIINQIIEWEWVVACGNEDLYVSHLLDDMFPPFVQGEFLPRETIKANLRIL